MHRNTLHTITNDWIIFLLLDIGPKHGVGYRYKLVIQ